MRCSRPRRQLATLFRNNAAHDVSDIDVAKTGGPVRAGNRNSWHDACEEGVVRRESSNSALPALRETQAGVSGVLSGPRSRGARLNVKEQQDRHDRSTPPHAVDVRPAPRLAGLQGQG